jgi:hypothetical protein
MRGNAEFVKRGAFRISTRPFFSYLSIFFSYITTNFLFKFKCFMTAVNESKMEYTCS